MSHSASPDQLSNVCRVTLMKSRQSSDSAANERSAEVMQARSRILEALANHSLSDERRLRSHLS
jgi:hypothetical protein